MLRTLGRRLTLLNVVISGAILVAMALTALGVAEQTMQAQYENDVRIYTSSILSVVNETNSDVRVNIMIPDKYYVYIEDEEKRSKIVSGLTLPEEEVDRVAASVRAAMDDRASVKWVITEDGPTREKNAESNYFIYSQTVRKHLNKTDSESVPAPAQAFFSLFTYTSPNAFFFDLGGVSYRVVPTFFGLGENSDMMLIFQDRTEELAAQGRLRWLFASCVAGGLFFIVMASLYLSGKAIQPVEDSIKKQREFVAAASHELRTPVAALRANAEVLSDADLGEYAPFLGSILDESDRMTRLVSDLLNLARADAGELSVGSSLVDAVEVAEDAYTLMLPLAKNHNLRFNRLSASALMTGDQERLRQILVALLDNALRYTPQGGEIVLSAGRQGHRAVLSVEDNGIGISEAHKARVFDRFYRVDAARSRGQGGAGLGLSVVKQLVDMMKGSVRVSDREGGGCVFEVSFQALDKPGARPYGAL